MCYRVRGVGLGPGCDAVRGGRVSYCPCLVFREGSTATKEGGGSPPFFMLCRLGVSAAVGPDAGIATNAQNRSSRKPPRRHGGDEGGQGGARVSVPGQNHLHTFFEPLALSSAIRGFDLRQNSHTLCQCIHQVLNQLAHLGIMQHDDPFRSRHGAGIGDSYRRWRNGGSGAGSRFGQTSDDGAIGKGSGNGGEVHRLE